MTAEGLFPTGVLGFLSGSISPDSEDSDTEGDIRRFIKIDLLVEAENENAAENIAPPVRLLSEITDHITSGYSFHLDGEWELVDVSEEPTIEPSASAIAAPSFR